MAREAELAMDERFRPRGVQRNSKTAVAAARDAERALAAAEAAVVTATRNKAARDRVKARAGGRPRATPGRKIVVVDEDLNSLPGAARSRDRSRRRRRLRRVGPVLGEADAPYRGSFAVAGLSPSPAPAARAPVRATARAFRPSKNELASTTTGFAAGAPRASAASRTGGAGGEGGGGTGGSVDGGPPRLEAHRPPASRRDNATG